MKKSTFLVPGIIMLGVVLRIPFTSIPPVLTDVAQSLGVSVDSLGILTSIPLIMFALFSSLAPKIAEKTGLERLFALVLLAMTVGSLIRIVNLPMLYLGTMVIGIGIAMMNVLLPSLVTANFPLKVGFYTTLYTTAMGLATAFASGIAVPLVKVSNWQTLILVLTVVCLLAFFIWLPNSKHNHHIHPQTPNQIGLNLWKNKAALVMLVFGGIQSLLFYTEMTWLPTMAQSAGLSKETAGHLAAYFSVISIPVSMVIPAYIAKAKASQRRLIMGLVCLLSVLGISLLFFINGSLSYWIVVNTLLSLSVSALFPYLLTAFSLKSTSADMTARLSAMVQTGGYLLAAVGPAIFGFGFQLTGSWHLVLAFLLILSLIMTLCLLYLEHFEKIA